MGKQVTLSCPHCNSEKIKRNGHHYGGKLQYFCHNCGKYFSKDVAKGYPVSKIPFPAIAYLLHYRKRVPEFSNMREFRKFTNQWLNFLGVKKEEIQRHTIRHWIKNYEPDLEKVISFEEARDFCHKILSERLKPIPKETLRTRTLSHTQALCVLEENIGHKFCVNLARSDRVFFDELCDLVSKYQLYSRQIVKDERFGQPKWRPVFMRFLKCING
jgi:hypothetical protein